MERSFFLKKRRADFVAGGLSGRVIVAGGLGEDGSSQLCCVVCVKSWEGGSSARETPITKSREDNPSLKMNRQRERGYGTKLIDRHSWPRMVKRELSCSQRQ